MELIIKNINKRFFNGIEETFSLNIPEIKLPLNSVVYLLGHNGSGKSLFVNLLSKECLPSTGEIKVYEDEKIIGLKKNDISVVRQRVDENICLDLTVEENLLLKLKADKILERVFPKRYLIKKAIKYIKEQKALLKKIKDVCVSLSGGQKQTLAYYMATMNGSKILCLDEFLSSTDYNTSLLLRQKVKEYVDKFNSVVIVISHDLSAALIDADLIYVFREGRVLAYMDRNDERWNYESVVRMLSH